MTWRTAKWLFFRTLKAIFGLAVAFTLLGINPLDPDESPPCTAVDIGACPGSNRVPDYWDGGAPSA